ncbi:hypothetical protein BO82DRAFT_62116 [Aspergillus uvarum CBS 121591]|uniref:Uncharacterized protein n=1 Tax=Aspergillus uvarum CBS 121591 TaxID=1448315 RepID=A0A319CGL6_9EURO|nr:hypothetical protein BO82DRAFT_62116 [Aspergillus uvarum CBS 121591]PYH82457.1 hypothetical protein BO82DRAFT_62116 [Aspergillus uvarum CBS 121591]
MDKGHAPGTGVQVRSRKCPTPPGNPERGQKANSLHPNLRGGRMRSVIDNPFMQPRPKTPSVPNLLRDPRRSLGGSAESALRARCSDFDLQSLSPRVIHPSVEKDIWTLERRVRLRSPQKWQAAIQSAWTPDATCLSTIRAGSSPRASRRVPLAPRHWVAKRSSDGRWSTPRPYSCVSSGCSRSGLLWSL